MHNVIPAKHGVGKTVVADDFTASDARGSHYRLNGCVDLWSRDRKVAVGWAPFSASCQGSNDGRALVCARVFLFCGSGGLRRGRRRTVCSSWESAAPMGPALRVIAAASPEP